MSKKVHVTMSPSDYAALQAWIASDKANRQNQPHDPPKPQQSAKPQPKSGGIDGLTVILLILIGLMVALGASAGEIDWQYTSDYSESIARCQARESGDAYPQFGSHEKNCMLHNGFSPIVENGHLIGWDDMRGNKHLAEGGKP